MGIDPSLGQAPLARLLFEIEGGEHWTLADFESELKSDAASCFLWELDGVRAEGFVLYRKLDTELWIMNLAVREKGKGFGRRLWHAFEESLAGSNITEIGLEVASRNAAAVRLYEASGFRLVGLRKNYYKNADDARVYLKTLR